MKKNIGCVLLALASLLFFGKVFSTPPIQILEWCLVMDNFIWPNSTAVENRSTENITLVQIPPSFIDPYNFSFRVIADTHFLSTTVDKFQGWYNVPLDFNFAVVAGDITNVAASTQYDSFQENAAMVSVPIYAVLGNHDIGSGWNLYKARFGKNYFSFEIGNTLIVFLDDASGTLGQTQTAWANELLSSTVAANKIIITHFRLYKLPCSNNTEILDIANAYGVQLVISGHEHAYYDLPGLGGGAAHFVVLEKYLQGANDEIFVTIQDGILSWQVQ
jgi:predicted phosphodiesterase